MFSIGCVIGSSSDVVQPLFAKLVVDWRSKGVHVVGVIGEVRGVADRTCSAGFLRDINSGKTFSIYLETPPLDTSCHVDAVGVDSAATTVLTQISECDLVVISKFGKLEAGGNGLARVFRAAIAAGKPLLTSVSEMYRDEWRVFAPNAIPLEANETTLSAWLHTVQRNRISSKQVC